MQMASTVLFFLVLYLHGADSAEKCQIRPGADSADLCHIRRLAASMALDPVGIVFSAYALAAR